MKRILIQNGTLYDGLGGQPYQADLLVQDDRIAQIAPGITEPADQVIDATGKVVTPGFVDIHRHRLPFAQLQRRAEQIAVIAPGCRVVRTEKRAAGLNNKLDTATGIRGQQVRDG